MKENSEDRNNRIKSLITRRETFKSKDIININSEDLEVEEERNLNDELSNIITRINSASKLSLDQNSIQQLNKIKSMARIGVIGNNSNSNLKLVDINVINKEIDKLYEITTKKK